MISVLIAKVWSCSNQQPTPHELEEGAYLPPLNTSTHTAHGLLVTSHAIQYNAETYLLHPESNFSRGHLQHRSNELTGDIYMHDPYLPCLVSHDGMTQQPLLHHLWARVTCHLAAAGRASRKHPAFVSHPTTDCITAMKLQSVVSIAPFSF